MQEKIRNTECSTEKNSISVVFRNHARCKTCKVKRRTIFCGLNTTELDQPGSKQLIYTEKNNVIIKAGEVLPYLYCIRDGWCRVEAGDPKTKTTTLWYAGPGDMIGLSSVCTGDKNFFTITAIDDVALCKIPAENFRKILPRLDGLSLHVAEKLSEEIARLEKRTDALRRRFIQKEIARIILRVFKKSDPQKAKKISLLFFSRQAQASRREIINCLTTFSLEKLIFNKRGKIQIADKDRLLLVAMNDEEWS